MIDETKSGEISGIIDPPQTLGGMLRKLGPGMIVAGSIVGSGELIATTKTGAEAGFYFLWLIIIGCVIKVFTQIELGRYTLTHGETPLKALDSVPGPRWQVNWIIWFWWVTTILVVSQQGGILGGIGQCLAITKPITTQGIAYNEASSTHVGAKVELALMYRAHPELEQANVVQRRFDGWSRAEYSGELSRLRQQRAAILGAETEAQFVAQEQVIVNFAEALKVFDENPSQDANIWSAIVAVLTSVMLVIGRFGFIQSFTTILVAGFTGITLIASIMLHFHSDWGASGAEVMQGLSFQLPPIVEGLTANPLLTALATFGIIGVGATELVAYPYWCLEKGYAKFTGPRDDSDAWTKRARGWMKVLKLDAWASMLVYTVATIAFYMMGASVLHRAGLNPEGQDMIQTLAAMYEPIFGSWTSSVFLIGAVVVLYSTFFVAAAAYARMIADATGLLGLHDNSDKPRLCWIKLVSLLWPLLSLALLLVINAPAVMVLASGIAQALMLPMIAAAALYFRYKRSDQRLAPGKWWDAMLWLSLVGFLVVAVTAFVSKWPDIRSLV